MIRHIVFFSAKDKADILAVRDGLSMLGRIPHASLFEVSVNEKVDSIGNEVDVVVYAEFVSETELAAFKAHPIYAECTSVVRPIRELRYSADIRSGA